MLKQVLVVALLLTATACAKTPPVVPGPEPADVVRGPIQPEKKLQARALVVGAEQVQANKPFAIYWDHDGFGTVLYRVEFKDVASGVIILRTEVPLAALMNGSAGFTLSAGLPRGDYTVTVYAAGETEVSDPSVPLNLTATAGKPKIVTNVRVVR